MSEKNVVINKPCEKNWDDMTPRGEGKFCGHCNKIVVDFTSMTDEQIIAYLTEKKGQKTCGYFKDEQVIVKRPKLHEYLLHLHSGLQKNTRAKGLKRLALSVVTFSMILVGCNVPEARDTKPKKTTGEVAESVDTTCSHDQHDENAMEDHRNGRTMGNIAAPMPPLPEQGAKNDKED